MKWQGDWISNHEEPADVAAQIADQLNIPTVNKLVENGHTVYRSVRNSEDLKIRLNVMERQTGQWYVVVQLESNDAGREPLIQLHKLCAEQLKSMGIQAQWNTVPSAFAAYKGIQRSTVETDRSELNREYLHAY